MRDIFIHPIYWQQSSREAVSSHVWCTQCRAPFVTNLSSPTTPQESAPNSCRVALRLHGAKKIYIKIYTSRSHTRRRTDVSPLLERAEGNYSWLAPVVAASHRRDNKLPTNVLMKYHQRTDAWLLSRICRSDAAENRSMKPLGTWKRPSRYGECWKKAPFKSL